MPPLLFVLIFKTIRAKVPWLIRPLISTILSKVEESWVLPNLKSQLEFIESHLESHPFFCGATFSAADAQMSFPLEAATASGMVGSLVGPKTKEWVETMHAREAYKKALEKGGPYSFET